MRICSFVVVAGFPFQFGLPEDWAILRPLRNSSVSYATLITKNEVTYDPMPTIKSKGRY